MKVSLCVPTFERPATTRILIESFLAQDHGDRELCIADDSRSDAIERLVSTYNDDRIVYCHQKEPLGFCGNLRSCLERSTGEVIVILGDDDLLARTDSLSIYAAIFASHPDIGFAHANVVQIDEGGNVTFVYSSARESMIFDKGAPALEHLLLSSVHIAGIAFQRLPDLMDLYPSDDMLFPQVKLAAEVLTTHGGMAIGAFLTAARMHADQLGFTLMQKSKTGSKIAPDNSKAPGDLARSPVTPRHGNAEVMELVDSLVVQGIIQPAIARTIRIQYRNSYATNMINEKIILGNRTMMEHFELLRQHNQEARRSPWLAMLCAVVLVLPRRAALQAKLTARTLIARRMLSNYDASRDWPLVGAMQQRQAGQLS